MNLSEQSKEIISALWELKRSLAQVLPKDLCEYIVDLVAKDQAHQKFLELTKD